MNAGVTPSTSQDYYDSSPILALISDNRDAADRLRSLAQGAGCRFNDAGDAATGITLIEQAAGLDGIVVDIAGKSSAATDRLLATSRARSDADRIPLIIATRMDQLDRVLAQADGKRTDILIDPAPADLVASLMMGLSQPQRLVADVATELDAIRLQRLADEVSRIAKALSNLTSHDADFGLPRAGMSDVLRPFQTAPVEQLSMPDATDVRAMIRLRRLRDRFFDRDLFADPAWDMLLDLVAARLEQAEVAVSSLCIAAAVPPTTALRWIKAMTDQGLFERCADPDDGRRIFIRLSDRAARGMFSFFDAMKRQGGHAV